MLEKKIKITFIGNQGVGKTCIISRYIYSEFPENPNNIAIANYLEKIIKKNNEDIKLDIWNSIGNEKFQNFGKYFYEDSNIVCFVYDITDSESFNSVKNVWYPQFRKNGDKNAIIGIVGNKSDLYEMEIFEIEEEAKKFAESIGALFMIISAKTGNGIQKLFDNFVNLYLSRSNTKENKSKDKNKNPENLKNNLNGINIENFIIINNNSQCNNININNNYININNNNKNYNNINDTITKNINYEDNSIINSNEIINNDDNLIINNINENSIEIINNNDNLNIKKNKDINNNINNIDPLANNKNNKDINKNNNINNNNNNINSQKKRSSKKFKCLCF